MARKINEILLEVKNLKTHFPTDEGVVRAVDEVSFRIYPKQTLGLVGESGCGKTVTALSIMGLLPPGQGEIVGGKIEFKNQDLTGLKQSELENIRGNEIGMVFQEPMSALNPIFTIGNQIEEAIILHQKTARKEAREIALNMLREVEIPSPEVRLKDYPHQLSGGMKQRAMIAMALCCKPELLIADEPTTALDVTVQASIIDLLKNLQKQYTMAILLITHDLGVVKEMADQVAVMYASRIVEYASIEKIFEQAKHPYTIGLLNSIPQMGSEKKVLDTIPGSVPHPLNFPRGCKFWPRCFFAIGKCRMEEPSLENLDGSHQVACWRAEKVNKASWEELSKKVPKE